MKNTESNQPKKCRKCNENLTDEHVKALSDALTYVLGDPPSYSLDDFPF